MHSPYGRCNLAAKVSVISGSPETALLNDAVLLFEMRGSTSQAYTCRPWLLSCQEAPRDPESAKSG